MRPAGTAVQRIISLIRKVARKSARRKSNLLRAEKRSRKSTKLVNRIVKAEIGIYE
jgi:hypothetical protein